MGFSAPNNPRVIPRTTPANIPRATGITPRANPEISLQPPFKAHLRSVVLYLTLKLGAPCMAAEGVYVQWDRVYADWLGVYD